MKRFLKILGISVGVLLLLAVVGIGGLFFLVSSEINEQVSVARQPAEHFDDACTIGDSLCETWTRFRQGHPYPYQTIAASRIVFTDTSLDASPDLVDALCRIRTDDSLTKVVAHALEPVADLIPGSRASRVGGRSVPTPSHGITKLNG